MDRPHSETPAHYADASAGKRRAARARKKASAPFFFGKQTLLFMAVCIGLVAIDLFLYIGIAIYESNLNFGNGSPKSVTGYVGGALVHNEDGSYTLPEDARQWMDEEKCWGMLISEDGQIAWSYNAPDEVVHPYTLSDAAVFSRMGYLEGFPCFVWQRDDGLLVTGFPKDSYAMNVIGYLPQQSMANWPLYVLLIFLVDAAVLFLVYSVSKRRVAKSIAPMIEALDELACGQPAHVQIKGSMREVGETINAASAVMRRKDEARKRWVTGVSHDIRTPLAICMGHAERIATDEAAGEAARESARIIKRQNERIRDLVSDLNVASKLEYDMQPVDVQPVRIARLVRSIAADYANTYHESPFSIEADIGPNARCAVVPLDERLVERALRNLVNNAIRHNEDGCTVRLFADSGDEGATIGVSDDGAGLDEAVLARLNQEARSIATQAFAHEMADGPTPPPHFAEYRPEKAAEFVRAGKIASADEVTGERADAENAPCDKLGETSNANELQDAAADNPTLEPKDLAGMNEHGLGLSLVARIAAAHGGRVEFSRTGDGGFRATLVFPTP